MMDVNTTLQKVAFQKTIDGRLTDLWTLKRNDIECCITNYGARIVSLTVPDKDGQPVDVVLGMKSIDDYIQAKGKMYGAAIGRYANRIANGRFKFMLLTETVFELPKNNGQNTLHGGPNGFHTKVWNVKKVDDHSIMMIYLSKDGEEGFPGNMLVTVTYMLTDDNALQIDYTAESDKMTVVNLSNHSYFNLNGESGGSIEDHIIHIKANNYTPVNNYMIPTGDILPVDNTPFDLRDPKRIGEHIDDDNEQLRIAGGYDHNLVLDIREDGEPDITVTGDQSGIIMDIFTDEPGVQFYTSNNMKGDIGKSGKVYERRCSFALETQHFPDSPNHPNFPNVVLHGGEVFHSATKFRFRK